MSLAWVLPAGAQVNLAKTICDGAITSGCTPLSGQPQIGQPVSYLITLDNSGQGAATFSVQEDLPGNFNPADPANIFTCVDSAGAAVTSNVTGYSPLQINVDLPAFEIVSCYVSGYFTAPGAVSVNTVSSVANPSLDATETTVVQNNANLPVDLALTKTSDTQGPLDLSAGPQTVTYTVTMTTDGDVYLDDYFSIYDQLGLLSNSVPVNAQLNPGSVSCSTTASGGGGLSCPVTNDFSGMVVMSPWQSFVSFGYGAGTPILMQAGDSLTLTYTVTYSVPDGQSCVIALNSDGVNNRAFLGLSDGGVSISDSNPANNDTAAAGNNTVTVDTGITTVDPDCIGAPASGSGPPPSPLVATKTFQGWQPGGNQSAIPWNQTYATWWVEVTNGSAMDTITDIDLTDVYSNLPHTPNHNVQLYAADIQQCPSTSSCVVTSPAPGPAPQGQVQAINSYFGSATLWTGTVDQLAPGETVGIKVTAILRKPTCDFAGYQQPKSVRNTIWAQHNYPAVDPFTGDPIIVPGTLYAYGDANVELTTPCDFKVRKKIVSQPDDEVTFGQPILYSLIFQNGDDPISAGTLMDVLRIEQDFYALGLDVSYQWACQDNPTGSVVNFTASSSGNGTVNYVQSPHQGLRVMEHPGFVDFAPYARLECKVEVIVSPPDPNDPYCYSNGTPTLGNAAIIDGSLFYNASLAWPPAPQGSTWDGASSELPKCYHLVVNKEVSPLTTTPQFGPDLTYTINITNASGSPSPQGDINFPPGPVPAGSSPWNGPVFEDSFQTGPFPTVPPANAPLTPLAADPCDIAGTDPCDWIAPPSVTGSTLGLSKLPAGSPLTYSYVMPHDFKPHQICNDISGEMLIDGASSDRWYAKNPVTLKDDVCAMIRTNLAITKTTDVHPLITLPSNTQFVVDINCTPPAGFNAVPMSQTFTQPNSTLTQAGIIVGSTCSIVEQTPDESLLPSHCDWNAPTYPNGQTITADGSQEPHKLRVNNSMTCRFGDFEAGKIVTGDAMPPAGTLFDMSFDCGAPSGTIYPLSLTHAGYQSQTDIPDGSVCTLIETPPADFTDDQGRDCVYGAPVYDPGQIVTISENNPQSIEVTNPVTCSAQQDVSITKQLDLGTSGLTLPAGLSFDMQVTCTEPSGLVSVNQTVSVVPGIAQTLPNVSMPATCTISEIPPSYQLPANCSWGDPTYVGGATQSFAYDQSITQHNMTVVNAPTCEAGTLRVRKVWSPGGNFSLNAVNTPPPGLQYTMNISCADGSNHSMVMGVSQSQSLNNFPANTSCTITETLPPYPGNTPTRVCSFNAPSFNPSGTFTVPDGGTLWITAVNSAKCDFFAQVIQTYVKVKKVVDVPGFTPTLSTTFDATVNCGSQSDTVSLAHGLTNTAGGFMPMIQMPGGAPACTVTETPPDNSMLPAGCTWNAPTYSPAQSVNPGMGTSIPVVTITNTATCAPVPGTLSFEKELIVPPGLALTPAPTFDVNLDCRQLPAWWTPILSSQTLSVGSNPIAVSGVNKFCFYSEATPTYPLPAGCNWLPPDYPNAGPVLLNSGQNNTRRIVNEVVCEDGAFTVEKAFTPNSDPLAAAQTFQVQIDCAAPMNTSTVHTLAAGTPVSVNGLLNTQCSVTELPPQTVEQCEWSEPRYEVGGVMYPGRAEVATSLNDPTVTVWNELICDFGPPILNIEKTLISNEPCLDPATFLFDCDFQVTITNTGGTAATGPFTVTDSLTGSLGFVPPTSASGGWNCTLPPPNSPPLPLSCDAPSGLTIPAGGSTSFVIDTHAVSLLPPSQNCASIVDQDGQTLESCVELQSPELTIEKTLLTPDCAYHPTSECLFEITVTNVGPINYAGPLILQDVAQPQSNWMTLPTVITTQPQPNWFCTPNAATSGQTPGHFCMNPSVNLPASGGSTTFQIGMDGGTFRLTDLPDNCASILFSDPLQESCVDIRWNERKALLDIEKTKITPGSCQGMGPSPQLCEFEITITNLDTIDYVHQLTVSDAVTGLPGVPLISHDDPAVWNCISGATIDCTTVYGTVIPVGGSLTLTLVLDMANPAFVDENCASLPDVDQDPIPTSCVTLEGPNTGFTINKTQITPGSCHGSQPAGAPNPNLCTFEIVVTNSGTATYTGDIVLTDQVMMGTYQVPATPANWGAQPDWNCVFSGPETTCTQTNVTMNPGDSVTLTVTMDISMIPAPYSENCATLITPQTAESCVPNGGPATDAQIQILKTYAPGSPLPPGNANFPISVECGWPTDMPAWANNYTTFGSPGAPTGNTQPVAAGATCTVTEQPIIADPGAGCTWLPPVYLPAQSVTPVAGQVTTVTVQNEIACGGPADFTITKTLAGPCTNAICDYIITLTNNGDTHIGPISVDDNFTQIGGTTPWHVGTNSADGWTCTPMGQGSTFACNVANIVLPTGGTTSFTMSFDLEPGAAYDNCASTVNPLTGAVISDCASVPSATNSAFDITKAQLTPGICHGGTSPGAPNPNLCEFEITITNLGPDPYQGDVTFSDLVGWGIPGLYGPTPPTAFSPAPWTCAANGNQTDCTYPNANMAVGQSLTMTVTLDMISVTGAGPQENCAAIEVPALTPAPEACIPIGLDPEMTIQKTQLTSGDCSNPPSNGLCEFEITVFNTGSVDYTGQLSVLDNVNLNGNNFGVQLPVAVQPASPWYCASQPAGQFLCETNQPVTVPAGGSVSFTVTLDLSHPVRADENCATLTGPQITPPPVSCVPLQPAQPADFAITKTLDGPCTNAMCSFTVTLTNNGDTHTGPISLDDNFTQIGGSTPWHVGTTSSDGWTCSPMGQGSSFACSVANITLPSGGSTSFTMTFDLQPGAAYDNCASTVNPLTNAVITDCASVPGTPPPSTGGTLLISKAISPTTPCDPDGICTFEITFTNPTGTDYVGPVGFTDTITFGGSPAAVPVVSQSSGWNCSASGTAINCNTISNVTVPANGSVNMTLTVNLEPTHPMHLNNCVTLTNPAQTPPSMDCVPVSWGAMTYMQVTKVIAPDSDFTPPAGTVFTVDVGCSGLWQNQTATVAPGASQLVNLQSSPGTCTVTETPPAVPASAPAGCIWDVPVYAPSQTVSVPDGGFEQVTVTNRMTCGSQAPNLTVTKELAGCSNAVCGFVITVTNNGPGSFTGPLNLTDLVSVPGTSTPYTAFYMSSSSSDPWQCNAGGASQTLCNLPSANLGAGDSTAVTLTMDIPSGQSFENCASLAQAAPLPPLEDCVIVPVAQQQMINTGGGTPQIGWDIGTAIVIPVAGDFITGDGINDIPLTESDNVGFDDAYEPDLGFSAGITYPLSDTLSVVGSAGYQSFSGQDVSLGTVDGEALTGRLEDMDRLTLDGGLQYRLPQQTLPNGMALNPYVEGRAGISHSSAIALKGARQSGAPVNEGNIGLYKDSTAPLASAVIGVEIPVNDNLDVAIEGKVTRSGALRSDDDYFEPGKPLAGTNNAESVTDMSVGVKLRSTF